MLGKQQDRLRAFQRILNSGDGASLLQTLQSQFHYEDSTHVPGDPYASAFREGQRSVVLWLMKSISTKNMKQVAQMIERAKEDEETFE